jgi:ketosteroid isomerase-like protein
MEHSDSRAKDRQEILAHIDSIFKAFAARDRETLSRTHLPDFKGFTVRSRKVVHSRDQYLQEIERLLDLQLYSAYQIVEEDFKFIGDVAIASYIAQTSGADPHGKPFETKIRVMDIYQRTPEGWNLAASSVSVHPDDIDRTLSAAISAIGLA